MKKLYFIVLLTLLCTACTAPQKIVKERYVWPPPPDVARIEWLKAFSSQLDIEKSSKQLFWASIAGEDDPQYLLKPVEVKSVPQQNRFYVSDIGRSGVIIFDLDKHEARMLGNSDGSPPIALPLSIALDGDGSIYVLERRFARIHVFGSDEKFQRAINLRAISVKSPTSMLIDKKKGHIYVSDAATRKIVVSDLSGTFVREIGGPGEGDGQFNLPVAMAFDSKDNLVVADAFSARIQIFNGEGRFVSKFGRRGDSQGDFQLIKSIAVDSTDNIYVVDGRAHNISIFNRQGELLLVFGGFYASAETGKLAPGGFSVPIGIDIDSDDKIYVVDQMNARVQVFQYFSEEYLRRTKVP